MKANITSIEHRRRIAGRHRDRAYDCLRRARQATACGNVAAAREYVQEARSWTQIASACLARRNRLETQP